MMSPLQYLDICIFGYDVTPPILSSSSSTSQVITVEQITNDGAYEGDDDDSNKYDPVVLAGPGIIDWGALTMIMIISFIDADVDDDNDNYGPSNCFSELTACQSVA